LLFYWILKTSFLSLEPFCHKINQHVFNFLNELANFLIVLQELPKTTNSLSLVQ
jgi:hypothetical protein